MTGVAQARDSRTGNGVFAAALALFVVLRSAAIVFVPLTPTFDSEWYYHRALAIAQGLGYSQNGVPTAFYPVGYSGFLAGLFALFGDHIWVGELANLVFGIGICFLMLLLSLRMFGNARAAALGVLVFALYPNQIGYIDGLSTEVIYPFLILLAFAVDGMGERFTHRFAFGLIMGAATLVKSQTLLLPIAVAGIVFLGDPSWRRIRVSAVKLATVYLGLIIVVAPWTVRNYAVFDRFIPVSTNDGVGLLNGFNDHANGDVTPDEFFVPLVGDVVGKTPADEIASDDRANRLAKEWVEAHPLRALELVPIKAWRLWAIDGESEWAYKFGSNVYEPFRMVFRGLRWINQFYYLLLIAGCAGAFYLLGRRRQLFDKEHAPAVGMIAYTTLVCMVFSGQSRYHHFLMPWIVMYAAWFATEIIAIRARQLRGVPQGKVTPRRSPA